MSRVFAFIRQDLRASLIASLLVLGHALLLTAVKARTSALQAYARMESQLTPLSSRSTDT